MPFGANNFMFSFKDFIYVSVFPSSFHFSGCENFLDVGFDYLKAVDLGYISPKLNELVQLFHSFG